MDGVKVDMVSKNITCEMTSDRRVCKEKHAAPTPNKNWYKGRRMIGS